MDIEDSETYKKIREHRSNCDKWGKQFCLNCFGGGLSKFIEDFKEEERQLEKKYLKLKNGN